MTPDLKKFEEKRKASLFETIGSTIWLGLEDMMHVLGFGHKEGNTVTETKTIRKNQISVELDKYENIRITRSK